MLVRILKDVVAATCDLGPKLSKVGNKYVKPHNEGVFENVMTNWEDQTIFSLLCKQPGY